MPPHTTEVTPPAPGLSRWFTDEVRSHDAQLKAYLRHSFPQVRDVDDLVQESYLRMWRTRAERPINSVRGFLFAVARRLAIDAARRAQNSPIDAVDYLAELGVPDDATSIATDVEARERIALLGQAIGRLPARCREAFVLHKIHGLSRRETAERLGLSERTVETQVARAMDRCGDYLRRRINATPAAHVAV